MYRALIHFVGDIHQPLHCVSRYTKNRPDGDRGGNEFKLPDTLYKNLHLLWDALVKFDDSKDKVIIKREYSLKVRWLR